MQPLSSTLSTPSAITDKILVWAQNTTDFNSILILIENPELIAPESLNVFISILSTMRCVHGVPIGLVFFSISKELIQKELLSNNINMSPLNGEVGVVFREFDSVPSKVFVGKFKKLMKHYLLTRAMIISNTQLILFYTW